MCARWSALHLSSLTSDAAILAERGERCPAFLLPTKIRRGQLVVAVFPALSHYFRVMFPRQPTANPGQNFSTPCMPITNITVRGARQHNLQDINVQIPRNPLTVITGLSGSGKSSLAFDTIYAEGPRRGVVSRCSPPPPPFAAN